MIKNNIFNRGNKKIKQIKKEKKYIYNKTKLENWKPGEKLRINSEAIKKQKQREREMGASVNIDEQENVTKKN